MAEDPAFIPRDLIYDDGCCVVPGGRTPKEINDEILRRQQNKVIRERNLEQLDEYIKKAAGCTDRRDTGAAGTI